MHRRREAMGIGDSPNQTPDGCSGLTAFRAENFGFLNRAVPPPDPLAAGSIERPEKLRGNAAQVRQHMPCVRMIGSSCVRKSRRRRR